MAYALCLAQRLGHCKFSDIFQYKFQSNAYSEPFTFIASTKTVSIWTSCRSVGYAAFLSSDNSSGHSHNADPGHLLCSIP